MLSNANFLSVGPLGTQFIEMWIKIWILFFRKIYLKMSSVKWWPFLFRLHCIMIGISWDHAFVPVWMLLTHWGWEKMFVGNKPLFELLMVIGIDHDAVCAGVVGTAIRHSTSYDGRRAAAPAGTTSAVPDCSTNHDSADRISGQFLFYHDQNFTKSKGNLRFRRLVPLFVRIGVCVTTHDDGTASDVTIGMWRHNQLAANHERNDKPWFSLPK